MVAKKTKPKAMPGKVGAKKAAPDGRAQIIDMIAELTGVVRSDASNNMVGLVTCKVLRDFLRLVVEATDKEAKS